MTHTSCVWTTNEEQLLKQLAGKATVNKISSLMGRSRQSIRSKATKLGLSLNFKRTQWDTQKIDELLKLRTQGQDWVAIGKLLKKSTASCQRAYSRFVCAEKKKADSKSLALLKNLKDILEQVGVEEGMRLKVLEEFKQQLSTLRVFDDGDL